MIWRCSFQRITDMKFTTQFIHKINFLDVFSLKICIFIWKKEIKSPLRDSEQRARMRSQNIETIRLSMIAKKSKWTMKSKWRGFRSWILSSFNFKMKFYSCFGGNRSRVAYFVQKCCQSSHNYCRIFQNSTWPKRTKQKWNQQLTDAQWKKVNHKFFFKEIYSYFSSVKFSCNHLDFKSEINMSSNRATTK